MHICLFYLILKKKNKNLGIFRPTNLTISMMVDFSESYKNWSLCRLMFIDQDLL